MDFGQEVKKLRDSAGITQNELAKRAGVSRNSIAGIESGTLQPLPMAAATLINLAKALGQEPLYFLLGVGLLNSDELDDYKQGNFIRLPRYFSSDDQAFLMGVINFISATYERGKKKPNSPTKDWFEGQKEVG